MYDIKKAIKAKGVTLKYIADNLNITLPSLSQQITDNTMSIKRLQEIADILSCPLTDLLTDADTPSALTLSCPHCGKPINITFAKK
jgi:transcriptional regulator with XRE-family HTH domain